VFGLQWLVADFILERRLRWLGHLGHMSNKKATLSRFCLESCKGQPFVGPKNVGLMGCCPTFRPLILTIVGILSARICNGINYVTLWFGKWDIPENRKAMLIICPHKR